jgi:hypothetical protein
MAAGGWCSVKLFSQAQLSVAFKEPEEKAHLILSPVGVQGRVT